MFPRSIPMALLVLSLSSAAANTAIARDEDEAERNSDFNQVEPLERGYGTTIGNSLRRVLLSSLEGGPLTPVNFGVGGLSTISTRGHKDLPQVGGGVSVVGVWRPIFVAPGDRPVIGVSPTVQLDTFFQSIDNGKQLNMKGGGIYATDCSFGMTVSPGLIMRMPLTDQCNFYCRAGGAFGFVTADVRQVAFNANLVQVPIVSPVSTSAQVGYFAGVGVEKQHNGHIFQFGVDYESHRTEFLTGTHYNEGQLNLRFIWMLGN